MKEPFETYDGYALEGFSNATKANTALQCWDICFEKTEYHGKCGAISFNKKDLDCFLNTAEKIITCREFCSSFSLF